MTSSSSTDFLRDAYGRASAALNSERLDALVSEVRSASRVGMSAVSGIGAYASELVERGVKSEALDGLLRRQRAEEVRAGMSFVSRTRRDLI